VARWLLRPVRDEAVWPHRLKMPHVRRPLFQLPAENVLHLFISYRKIQFLSMTLSWNLCVSLNARSSAFRVLTFLASTVLPKVYYKIDGKIVRLTVLLRPPGHDKTDWWLREVKKCNGFVVVFDCTVRI
jgi:hypothetical protein